MSRENARNTENAWRKRDEEAARNQERAAGRPADIRFGNTSSQTRTMRVQIVGGDESFFAEMRRAMGISEEKPSQTANGGLDLSDFSTQLQSIITDQQAISQATKQVAQDLSLAVNMVMNYQASIARQMGTYVSDMSSLRQQETAHMQNLVGIMSSAVARMQAAAPPAAGGGGGGGGGGGTPPPPPGPPGPPTPPGPPNQPPRPPGQRQPHTPRGNYRRGGSATSMGQLRQRMTTAMINRAGGPNSFGGRAIQGMQSAGIRGALRANFITGIPLAAMESANDVATFITNQRQQNAQYQAIYGGENFSVGGALSQLGSFLSGQPSSDTSGFGQRMAEEGFVLSQRFSGGMTGDQARQAFQGVSQLGFAGNQRDTALQFISDNYKQMGMDIAQSIQLVQAAAQNGNQSLGNLAQQLQAVSAQAAATGQNAAVLRQQFAGYYTQGLQSGLGAGSGAIAQVLTQTTSGTNRDLANVNYNSLLSNPVLMQTLAAQNGMTLGQMEAQVAQGNTGAFTQALSARTNQILTGSMDQNLRNLFNRQVQQAGGFQRVAQTPGSQYNIAVQLMQSRDWNVMQARAALGTLGVDTSRMNDEQVAEFYVSQLTSGGVGAAGRQQQAKLGQLTPQQRQDASKYSFGGSPFIQKMLADMNKNGGPGLLDWASQLFGGDTTENQYKSAKSIMQAYQGYESQSGVSNPAIESMIKTLGTTGSAQLRVKTPQGDRVVSMQDAIKYYSDQISTGSAIVVGGPQNGKTLGEASGTVIAGFRPPRPGGSAAHGPGNIGQSWQDYSKAHPSQQQGSAASSGTQTNGTVTVAPSPMLMQMFNWSSSGGVNIVGSTAQGVTPLIPGGPH